MSCSFFLETVGFMAYYILKPLLILHAILSTSWKVICMVQGLAAVNAQYTAEQAALILPISHKPERPSSVISQTSERPLSTISQNTLRPLSTISQNTLRPLSGISQTSLRPLSARYPSGHSIDVMLQQQLAELETEKAQQRWSRLPSYSLHDIYAGMPPTPPLSPGDFNFSRKPLYGEAQPENEIRIMVYPVEKQGAHGAAPQLNAVETMRYVPAVV